MEVDSELDYRNTNFDLTSYLYADSTEDELELERDMVQNLTFPIQDNLTDVNHFAGSKPENEEYSSGEYNLPPTSFKDVNLVDKFLSFLNKSCVSVTSDMNVPPSVQYSIASHQNNNRNQKSKGEGKVPCIVCRRRFTEKKAMKDHVREVHFKPQVFCSVCGRRVAVANIDRHKQEAHNINKVRPQ